MIWGWKTVYRIPWAAVRELAFSELHDQYCERPTSLVVCSCLGDHRGHWKHESKPSLNSLEKVSNTTINCNGLRTKHSHFCNTETIHSSTLEWDLSAHEALCQMLPLHPQKSSMDLSSMSGISPAAKKLCKLHSLCFPCAIKAKFILLILTIFLTLPSITLSRSFFVCYKNGMPSHISASPFFCNHQYLTIIYLWYNRPQESFSFIHSPSSQWSIHRYQVSAQTYPQSLSYS